MENASSELARNIIACRKCPRLIGHCQQVAQIKRRAYRDWIYWSRPVPSFGSLGARLLILGLAPGAHGANRTGRIFTGDSSGNLLYRVLHANGFASQPVSISADDGLELIDARITCAVHCAPPSNKPLPVELRNCRHWLERELEMLPNLQVVVALGRVAFDSYLALRKAKGELLDRTAFPFSHAATHTTGVAHPILIASYHPSQQNTSTGKLTEAMLFSVFEKARQILFSKPSSACDSSAHSALPDTALSVSSAPRR